MIRVALACALILPAGTAVGQTAFVPPGGTNAQGATGGIATGGHVIWGPPAAARAPGDGATRYSAARADQVRRGFAVYSVDGPLIGTVAYADGKVAVVESNRWALRLPVEAFGIKQNGLLLAMTPARFEALARMGGASRQDR